MAGTRLAATVVLLLLCWSSHEADAQALTVEITVDRTDPPGFTPESPTEYRAASGPQVFTCTATGGAGTGSYVYVWTSTCSGGCAFRTTSTETTSIISQATLHSGDNGTHTCTATRGGESGSDSIVLNIVGYGIHIFRGTSTPSSTDTAGSLPNNGLVIAAPTGDGSGRFLRIFCRSDSMMANVGDIIGLDGTVISNGRFVIERGQPGEITMVNSATQGALPSSEQGVYTCRIPDSTNTMRNINVGLYIAGFNTVPTITNTLVFTPGCPFSTLTCTSTGSVATTVTFMRGITTVGPLRDGESMDFGGVTYQLAQTVTDRAQSTYENVLTINQPLASIVGSSFTCSVENTVGTSPSSNPLQIIVASCDFNPCQNGGTCMNDESGSFTCDCIAGYTGDVCETDIDDCDPNPCLNGGTCNDEVGGFMCDCIRGFTGDTCDTAVEDGSQDLFQIQFGPVEHCISWNSEKATSLENAINSAIISVLGNHCECMFPPSHIDSGHFTCLTTPMQATYRSTISGIVGNNATHLLSVLQDWVSTGPVIKLDWMLLHMTPDCPIHIASMADPECSLSELRTFGNPTLITSDSVVIQCVNVCLLRTRGRGICGV